MPKNKTPLETKRVAVRPAETETERALYCAGMLFLSGLLSDAERRKVHKRMIKTANKNNVASEQ